MPPSTSFSVLAQYLWKKTEQEKHQNYIDVQDRQLWKPINNLKTSTHTFRNGTKIVGEYDQDIPQSQTVDNPMASRWDNPTKFEGPDYEKNISTLSMCGEKFY